MGIKVRHNGQWIEMGFAGAPGGEPVGTIIAWGGSAANIPSNFRLCNGQALSRTTYSDLFSKLGTIHGSGDGSTTFNIPDLRNKFIVGAKNTTSTTYPDLTVGATGGSADAVVVGHSHTAGTLAGSVTDRYFRRYPDSHLMEIDGHHSDNHGSYKDVTRTVTITGSTSDEGVSATNANLPPYYALCYIIKIDTSSATGSGVADGDYGDITVSNSGTVWNIDQNTIGPTELIATGVSAGTYTNPSITVDEDGRLTAASSGSAPVTTFLGLSDTPSTYVPSAGKVLVVNSTQNGVEFVDKSAITSGLFQDKISEGDSKAEIIDTATESKLTVEIDATEKVSISTTGPRIHRQDSYLEGGSISFTRAADDILAFEIDVYGPSSSNSNRFRIVDQSIYGGVERFAIGPNGEIGLGYVSNTSADYGTAGQVLTSGGPGVGATWADASGGVGSSDPVGTIVAWAGSVASIPSEYQLCDGGAAATSELQAITGTNVPDLRDRFVVGAGSGYSPGNTGGANTVTLTLNQIPAHNHFDTATNGGAGPSQWGFDVDGNGSSGRVLINDGPPWNGIVGNLSRGGGQAHENRPPYYALCYIIKHTATSGSGGGSAGDKISEGDTEAEVVDTGFDGHFKVTTEGTERLRVTHQGIIHMGRSLTDDPVLATGNVNAGVKLLGATTSSSEGDGFGLVANAKSIVGIFNRTNTTGRIVEYKYNGSVVGAIESDANNILEILGENATKFKVAGDEKLRITSNGKVGIGTTNPSQKLTVESSVIPVTIKRTTDAGDLIYLRNNNFYNVIGGDNGSLYFKTNGTATSDEKLRIGPAGQIGLSGANYGTPGQVLVSAGTNAAPSWQDGSNITGFSTDKISEGNTEAEVVDTGSDGHFKVTTEGTERLRITSNGNVGINTNSPDPYFHLDVNGNIALTEGQVLTWHDRSGNKAGDIYMDSSDNFVIRNTDNVTERFRITSNGSVGIGTSIPEGGLNPNPLFGTKLDVFKSFVGGGDRSFVGRFYGLDTNVQETSVRFITKGTGGTTADLHNASDAYLMHGISNGYTKFVFGANGNVGIGSTIPREKLDISAGRIILDQDYQFTWANGTTNRVRIYGDSGDNFVVENGSSNTERLRIGSAGQIGLGGANYGTSGQVLTSNGSGSAPTWEDASGGGGSSDPVGTIVAWGGSTSNIPSEYTLCNGASLSRTEYADLFAALGTVHGSGDGSTTFNIPDLRNQFIVGAKNGGNNTYPSLTVGATGGSADAVVVQHNHGITEPNSGQGHRHVYTAATSIGGHTDDGGSPDQRSTTKNNLNTNYSTTGITINNEGVSGTNANLPPYYALCYIIKHTATSGSGSGSGSGFVLLGRKSATGTSVEFTGIPANALEITLMFEGVSGSSATDFDVQLGTSSGYITSNYNSSSETATGNNSSDSTSSFVIRNDNANGSFHGSMIINKSSSDSYSEIGQFKKSSASAVDCYGSVYSISGVVDRLKVSISNSTFDTGGLIGLSYKTSGSSGGSAGDKIQEGDSKAEIIDTATESKFTVEIDATEKFSVDIAGPKIHRQDNSNEGGSLVFNRAVDDVAAFELDVYGSSSSDSGVFRIIDATGGGERFLIGPAGQIGLGGANYGTSGQVLTSNGSGSAPTWQDSSGGGGGTVSSGTFTATAGSPSTLESYTYDSAELVFEYTVFVKNGSNYQTQKLLVMRDGTTVDSSQYAVMYNSNLLVQLDATISGGNVNLRATPETGVSGSTTYRIKREVV